MLFEQRPSSQTHVKGLRGSQLGTDPHSHTRTDRPAPVLPLPLLASVVCKGASMRTVCCAVPHSQPMPLQTVMPSRQLCGGSCLDHLKADGWARICCHPPGSEAAAPGPGHRLRQMDCLSGHPHMESGSGQAPSVGLLAGSPPLGP